MKEYVITIETELFMDDCYDSITEVAQWRFLEDEVLSKANASLDQEVNLSVLKRFAKNTLESVVITQIHALVRKLCYLDPDVRDTNSTEILKSKYLKEIADDSISDRFYTIYVYDAEDITEDDENREYNQPDPVAKWSMWKSDIAKEMLDKAK